MSTSVVVLLDPATPSGLVERWRRHVARTLPDARLLTAPEPATGPDDVVVEVDAGLAPPPWQWLPALLAAVRRPGVAAAQPVPVTADHLVTAPVGTGLPVSVLERFDGRALPARLPGALARRAGAGATVLAAGSWLVAGSPSGGVPWPGWSLDPEPVPGTPSLRWALDIAAPAAPLGRRWGDWHFARSLADALERLGQRVTIDHPETRGRATRADDDVVLVLRGLERVAVPAAAVSLLWVISHPEQVGTAELAGFDRAFAAGTAWAAAHTALGVRPLLQCTDATRFHPDVVPAAGYDRPLFVGNARGGARPVVLAAAEAGLPVDVVGSGWAEHGVAVRAEVIANADLPAAYAGAPVVLADHHDDMRRLGFVANRVLDVLAVGGRLVVDDVAGLDDLLASLEAPGDLVRVWRTPADLAPHRGSPDDHPDDHPDVRRAVAERVVERHSFDARAATLLAAALEVRQARGAQAAATRRLPAVPTDAPDRSSEQPALDPSVPLPPYELRMGGRHFKKDADFVAAGVRDAKLLRQRAGLGRRKRVLDWGCGAGRLAIGIKHLMGEVADYHGVDVQPELLGWAQDHLAGGAFRFTLVDAQNARYNPDGAPSYDIPAEPGSVDVFYAYSVFSHMLADDVAGYSATIARLLAPGGRAMMTAFVEDDVPDCVENPDDYLKLDWKGALHCVRFDRRFFEQTLLDAGLAVAEFVHGRETDGQSLYVLTARG